ncbi:hypothetical protein [Alienimonas californiensis]|uniref:Uncharacterized protein n=1 Tax=Alienimonas californiensis TaxID=2527989 RepID=A0A517P872_9PLAN|nr:hypothetical protein [Alienimonas californiensis]QDT15576.1 hypothetical protein CA12_16610 [Alienimonas californiensis]
MQHQPVPEVDAADVDRVLARDYAADRTAAEAALAGAGFKSDQVRVKLAALKLAGGDIERLAELVGWDPRDLMLSAEYAAWARQRLPKGTPFSQERFDRISREDFAAYRRWLGRNCSDRSNPDSEHVPVEFGEADSGADGR